MSARTQVLPNDKKKDSEKIRYDCKQNMGLNCACQPKKQKNEEDMILSRQRSWRTNDQVTPLLGHEPTCLGHSTYTELTGLTLFLRCQPIPMAERQRGRRRGRGRVPLGKLYRMQ